MFVPKPRKPLATTMIAALPPYTLLYGVVNTDATDTITAETNVYGEFQRLERLVVVKFVDIVEKNSRITSCRVEASLYRVVDVNITKDIGILKIARIVVEKEPNATIALDVERRNTSVNIDNVIDIIELRFPIMVHYHHVVFTFGLLDDMYALNKVTYSKYIYSDLPWKLLCGEAYTTSFVARIVR